MSFKRLAVKLRRRVDVFINRGIFKKTRFVHFLIMNVYNETFVIDSV